MSSIISRLTQQITLYCAKRDGDLCFIECPACHSVDLRKPHMFLCRDCGTFFTVYEEDGWESFPVLANSPQPIPKDISEVRVVIAKSDIEGDTSGIFNDFYLPHPVEVDALVAELGERHLRTVIACRDLHHGKDAHEHDVYQRYVLIPQLPQEASDAEV